MWTPLWSSHFYVHSKPIDDKTKLNDEKYITYSSKPKQK